jgi:hypothetical protein
VLRALRVRLAGSPQLRRQPAEDIGHDLMTNGYLPTEPDPALVRRALQELRDEAPWERDMTTERHAESVGRYDVPRSEIHREQALAFYRRVALEHRVIAAGHQAKADALRRGAEEDPQ